MLFFAVLAERFSVVAQQDNRSAVVKLVLFQPCDQASQFVIGIRNFAVIRMCLVLGAKRFRWIVRAMGIVQMQPEEKRAAWSFFKPRQTRG